MTILKSNKHRGRSYAREAYGSRAIVTGDGKPEEKTIVNINQRMFLMLAAALSVLFLLLAVQPDSEAGAADAQAVGDDQILESIVLTGQDSVLEGATSPTTNLGSLSPVFTDEVRYWEQDILGWAKEYDLDPDLVAIIMQVESCGDPQAVSIAGAQGLFQVMPFHFIAGEDSLDPDTNARRGINYFVDRLSQTGGDIGRSYAGYNGGHVAAGSTWDNWAYETQRYYIWTTGLYGDIQSGLDVSP
ncbi:MAG: transglycosylase SLT domain-containing protein, partial [Candidatus Promineifilaceae bacterium]